MKYKKILFICLSFFLFTNLVNASEIEDNLENISIKIKDMKTKVQKLNVLDYKYPVGSIYISVSSENPSNILGGIWEAYAEGRTLIGVSDNNEANQTGGNSKVNLTEENLPEHTHEVTFEDNSYSNELTSSVTTSTNGNHSHSIWAHISGAEAKGYCLVSPAYSGQGYTGRVIVNTWATTNTSALNSNHTHTITNPTSSITETKFIGVETDTEAIGSNSQINIQSPYITVYIWKRTK